MSADPEPFGVEAQASQSFPYIIECLRALDAGDEAWTAMFGRNLHFGLWDDPANADTSPAGFSAAAENMTRRIIELAAIAHGSSVLDVGCGFGGTCDALDRSFSGLHIIGVNIDPTQIARARSAFVPTAHNVIEFVEGDACALPQADDSADVILAVECAFHFRSRAMFLLEAGRVLRPGGRIVIADFVAHPAYVPAYRALWPMVGPSVEREMGRADLGWTRRRYRRAAAAAGLRVTLTQDVSVETLPSFAAFDHLSASRPRWSPVQSQARLQRWRLLRYELLVLEPVSRVSQRAVV